jgi:pantothenate kinase
MPIIIRGLEEARKRILDLESKLKTRVVIGITGKPGAGKSTVTSKLKEMIPGEKAVILSQDGYHLSNLQLESLGRSNFKGAPDTFDSEGFAKILLRVKSELKNNIYFPIFHREIEESISAEGLITEKTNVVLVEGNYLLFETHGWGEVAKHLDEIWYLQVDDDLRLSRLVARHIEFGKNPQVAAAWAQGSDEANARLIERVRDKANAFLLV